MRISEIPHVEHGRIAICACQGMFRIDDATVVEEYSLPDLPPPESIGRYKIVRYVGRGASNCVYEGINPETGVRVAIKTLHPDYAGDKPSRERFLHAAKIYAKATIHPDIVQVYETGKDANGVPFLAMEFLAGGSLADRMTGNKRFSAKETAEIGVAVCRALTVTAGLGIVHRDIKPDNIMISGDGQYKLTDLGLAKLDAPSASENKLCVLDENRHENPVRKTSFGTLEYMSPEQFIDADSCDIRSDIYSLGVTMYQMAAGRLPFEPRTRSELRHMHLSVEPLVPSTYVPDIPIDFDYIILHCIQKKPEDRYQTPDELLADLEAFLADKPLPSTTSGAVPVIHTPAPARTKEEPRRSMLLPAIAVVLVVLILCVLGLHFLIKHPSAQEQPSVPGTPSEREPAPETPGSSDGRQAQHPLSGMEGIAEAPAVKQKSATEIAAQYMQARQEAELAMKNGFGFREAISNLEVFSSFDEYAEEANGLIARLQEASTVAVRKLMDDLGQKAAPFLEVKDFNGAIDVYRNNIGPLATESQMFREQAIYEIEQTQKNQATEKSTEATEADESAESAESEEKEDLQS